LSTKRSVVSQSMHGSVIDMPYTSLLKSLGIDWAPALQMTLEHQADDRTVAVDDLRDAIFRDQGLQIRILCSSYRDCSSTTMVAGSPAEVNCRSATAMLTAS